MGAFQSNIISNPKEQWNAISLSSGKEVVVQNDKKKVEKQKYEKSEDKLEAGTTTLIVSSQNNERPMGAFQSNIISNPKEQWNAISLSSGKEVVVQNDKKKVEKQKSEKSEDKLEAEG
ncbi:hypothetical protein ACH5RR_013013 [Cinchona calisaya]|uniref:Uncharacterized protein n=1 Tax=Cinchona calisaya TaxID=153742 RepID=A0ABD2ZYV3_9GENT